MSSQGTIAAARPAPEPPAPVVPEGIRYLDLVTKTPLFSLDASAQQRLLKTGFVEVQEPAFDGYLTGYADLFAADLPVWVTIDSLAQPLHSSFEEVLTVLERERLAPDLTRWLDALRRAVPVTARHCLACDDLDVYLTVAASLAQGKELPAKRADNTPKAWSLIERLTLGQGSETETFSLFDRERTDFPDYYVPRGHYLEHERLEYYYRAVTWLNRQPLELVRINADGAALNRPEVEAAAMIARAVRRAGLGSWSQHTLDKLVGRSGSLTPQSVLSTLRDRPADPELVERLLDERRSQLKGRALGTPVGPVVFSLAGARTSLDANLFEQLPAGSTPVDPSDVPRGTDVGYAAFGNDSALALSSRQRSQRATERLMALRREVDGFGDSYWADNLFAEWFGVFRALSHPPQGSASVIRSDPWSRRVLATQLSAWAELRHDTSLYLTLSTAYTTCAFPDAYVDPYPEAWKRLGDWVGSVAALVRTAGVSERSVARVQTWSVRARAILHRIARMAQAQGRGETISTADLAWMNGIATADGDCSGDVHSTEGWYKELHIDPDRAVLQAPVVATACEFRGPDGRRILHIGTGNPRAMVVVIDGPAAARAFVGLVSSFREAASVQVLDDESWRDLAEPDWLRELFGAPAAAP